MYLQEILEVAIGLVFVWLVISIASMSIQEWIADILKWRSKDLESSIRKMLADPNLAKNFYDHQLIRGLSKDAGRIATLWNSFVNFLRRMFKLGEIKLEYKPSYIPANDFALTLFDMVTEAGTDASPIQKAFKQVDDLLNRLGEDKIDLKNKDEAKKALQTLLDMAKDIAASDIGKDAVALLKSQAEELDQQYPQLNKALTNDVFPSVEEYYKRLREEKRNAPPLDEDQTLYRLRLGLVAIGMNNPKLQESLRSLLTGAEGYVTDKETALALVRNNVTAWFDNSMARLSGWYKRKAQFVAFLVGLFLAILLNVDSIMVATSLWREPTLRQSIVAQAEAYTRQNEQLSQSGTTIAPPQKTVSQLQEDLSALKIPFGWETEHYPLTKVGESCQIIPVSKNAMWGVWSNGACKRISNAPVDLTGWLSKIGGILFTALAAAQGAPFWFDILKKLVNVRSSGPKPEEAQTTSRNKP